jgi:type II secretory pathway predicted ATPase ExeA
MSYLQHFGLKHPPIHKGSATLWNNESLKELEFKFHRLLKTPGIGVLTGEYGLGKTAALRNIIKMVDKNQYSFTYTADTNYGRNEFYRIMARNLGVELAHKRSDLWTNIRVHLIREKRDRKVLPVFIIDEAHQLHRDFLMDLSSFLNFNYDSEDILSLWLVGHSDFISRLNNERFGAIKSRIRIVHDMQPIKEIQEFKEFLKHAFKVAGLLKLPIGETGIKTILQFSGGVPRKVHNIIVNSLEIAYKNDESVISEDTLEEAICGMLL